MVNSGQLLLPSLQPLFQQSLVRCPNSTLAHLLHKLLDHGVQPLHRLAHVLRPVLDLHYGLGLEDASRSSWIGVHLHHAWVDRWVNDDPAASAELSTGREVDHDRLLVSVQGVHDVGTEFDNLRYKNGSV